MVHRKRFLKNTQLPSQNEDVKLSAGKIKRQKQMVAGTAWEIIVCVVGNLSVCRSHV